MKWMFKEDHSLEHRCVESAKIRAKYPDRVPASGLCLHQGRKPWASVVTLGFP
uniref:GABA type A receptor associated protein like 2 n=1 Tax=Rhinopithecus bieti TaxID=61621 RepID=A0A2K6M6U6_RHIBE